MVDVLRVLTRECYLRVTARDMQAAIFSQRWLDSEKPASGLSFHPAKLSTYNATRELPPNSRKKSTFPAPEATFHENENLLVG